MRSVLSRFIQGLAICALAVSAACAQSAIENIDGNWFSPQWKYGYVLKSGVGIATSTNSPNFRVGQNIIQLTATSETTFTGQQVYTDGKFYKVNVTLQADGRLYFEGEKNVKWLMERVDATPQAAAPTRAPAPAAPAPRAAASGGEVGDKLFVVAPRAAPIHISKGGTRYWNCNGMVSTKLIDIVYQELVQVSNEEGVAAPSTDTCHYKIGTFNAMGNSIPVYTIEFYTNRASMDSCVIKDYCADTRSMTFRPKNDELYRQYMVTSVSKRLNRMACIAMSGQVVNARGGC